MTSLIKSTRIIGEPVVLGHAKKLEADLAIASSPLADSDPSFESSNDVAMSEDVSNESLTLTSSTVEVEESYISYEEYKSRFEAELRDLEEEAKERGFEQGKKEGFEKAQEEYVAQTQALAGLVASLRAALDDGIEGTSEIGIEIVCEAITKILGDAMVDRDGIISIVRQVVRKAKERTKLVVRVSPADWSILEGHEAELVEGFSAGSVEIVADDRVQIGGCLLETPAGALDGRLEVQLERLRDAMLTARSPNRERDAAA